MKKSIWYQPEDPQVPKPFVQQNSSQAELKKNKAQKYMIKMPYSKSISERQNGHNMTNLCQNSQTYRPWGDKACLQGFRQNEPQTILLSYKIGILLVVSLNMILFNKRITKALIRLHGCTGWSTPLLFANPWRQVFSRRGPHVPKTLFQFQVFQHLRKCHLHISKTNHCKLDFDEII